MQADAATRRGLIQALGLMRRTTPFMLLVVFASAVVASPVVLRAGDPSLDGKDYLISEQDFRDILKLCRARLGSGASKSVYNVRVLRRDTVAAYSAPTRCSRFACSCCGRREGGRLITKVTDGTSQRCLSRSSKDLTKR